MKKQILDLRVIENRRVNIDYVVLTLTHDDPLPEILPGQFVEMRVDNSPNTFLRRPFSVYDVDYKKNTLLILLKEVGDGSKNLGRLKQGEVVNTIIPLGNRFSIPQKQNGKLLLIGGGVGVAPLYLHGKILKENGFTPTFLIGARDENGLVDLEKFEKLGEVHLTTEDGSVGTKGFVVHSPVFSENDGKIDAIYTCGPDPMMRAIAAEAYKRDISCEVSLENLMACGFGACLCCVADTIYGNVCSCTDGPVFNINVLKWQTSE